MTTSLKNRWVRVAFVVHCGETLAAVSSKDEGEPAWHRLAIDQALACAKVRATLGGPLSDDGWYGSEPAIVLNGQYFDHYDIDALSSALGACWNTTKNTAAEVEMSEADLFNSATALANIALAFAFHAEEGDDTDLVATTISWMANADSRGSKTSDYEAYAKACLGTLSAAESVGELQPDDPVPEHVMSLLEASRALISGRAQASTTRTAPLVKRGFEDRELRRRPRPDFTFVDLFAGIGGMRLGVEAAGGGCVSACEIDASSGNTYRHNFSISAGYKLQDIREVHPSDIPGHDLLVAGVPCEPFATNRVSLFSHILEVLHFRRPAAFMFETVKGFQNQNQGRNFEVVRDHLARLAYQVHWRVINASSWVPQHRERLFIVGFREENDFDFGSLRVQDPPQAPLLRSILHPEDGTEREEAPYTEGPQAKVDGRYTLTDHLWNYLQRHAEKHHTAGKHFGFGLVGPDDIARTLSARYYKDGSEILINQSGRNPRRLTPRECARLMGFDRGNQARFAIPVSDTQAYRQFGNASVPPVVEAVITAMKPYLVRAIGARQLKLP
jgi:DNA (cytosine-5)-methyltransferase 1